MSARNRARGRAFGRGNGSNGDENRRQAPGGEQPFEAPAGNRNNNNEDVAALPRGGLAPRGGAAVNIQERIQRMQESRDRRLKLLLTPKTRPPTLETDKGSTGDKVELACNFFRIQNGPTWLIYEYRVDFEPEVEFFSVRRLLIASHKDKLGSYLFDGNQLITPTNLPDEETVWTATRDTDNATITIKVRSKREIAPDDIQGVRILSIAIKEMQRALDLKEGRDGCFFNPRLASDLKGHDLTIWPGFTMTVANYERELMLNMDICHRVIRTDSVYTWIEKNCKDRSGQFQKEAVERELIGATVLTKYNKKDRTYKIDDILWPPEYSPGVTKFKNGRGDEMTIAAYMESQYGIKIRDLRQPLLVSRARKLNRRKNEGEESNLLLVPELCFMSGFADEQRKNNILMKGYAEITRLTPRQRVDRYRELTNDIAGNPSATRILANWNLKIDPEPVTLQGRVLPVAEIIGGQNRQIKPNPNTAEWSNDLKDMPVFDPVPLLNWAIVYQQRHKDVAREFHDNIKRVGAGMGIQVGNGTPIAIDGNRPDHYRQGCLQAVRQVQDCKMVVCLLAKKTDRQNYEVVKKVLLVDIGIPTQCAVITTLQKPGLSVATGVMRQLAIKLGGSLWRVHIPFKSAMICGFDTYHDSSSKGDSVGAFVATIDPMFTKYYSRTFKHKARAELSSNLVECIVEALKTFHSRNGQLPENIVFYRDGVADNQLQAVYEKEIPQLREGFKLLGSEYEPKLSFVVIQKRIRPRFFMRTRNNGQLMNPRPGTIVDNTVTDPRAYDFYIMAQSVRQGTVTPCRYNIIYDSTNLTADRHHQLAYKLSQMYFNWAGSIRVVAPCHYAHKLAYLVGQHVHTDVNRRLWTTLYYA